MAKLHLAQEILDIIYPVGSVYLSWNSMNPSTYFGGIWIQLKGGFLYGFVESPGTGNGTGISTGKNNGNTGSTTLTVEQIPSHTHKQRSRGNDRNIAQAGRDIGYKFLGSSGMSIGETFSTSGGKGHTHTLNSHSHNIPYIAVSVWRRTE